MRTSLLFILLFFTQFVGSTQAWIQYTSSNSPLPHNQVQAVFSDRNNVKWIGTDNGLARFDGSSWQIFYPSNSALPSASIRALAIDRQNNLWVGTDNGLAKYNGADWTVYTKQNSGLPRNTISHLVYDNATNLLWVATEVGLLNFDGNIWTNMESSNHWLADEVIQSLIFDRAGVLWVGSFNHFQFQGRLYRFDDAGWKRIRLEQHGLTSAFPATLAVDEHNNLWMGTKGTISGQLVQVREDQLVVNDKPADCFSGAITGLIAKDGKKFLTTVNGFVIIDRAGCKRYDAVHSNLPDNVLSSIYADGTGTFWIGTIHSGLLSFNYSSEYIAVPGVSLQVNPNPVRGVATVAFELTESGPVNIQVWNATGVLVDALHKGVALKGKHSLHWHTNNFQKGLYFCTISFGKGLKQTQKVIVE